MAKREALEQFHKETISAVADRLFAEHGYTKTTMDDIAREADYSKATLYVYFKNKEEIFYYIANKAMHLFQQRVDAGARAGGNALAQYRAICRELVAFSEEYPFYYESIFEFIPADEASRRESPVLEEIYQAGERVNDRIGEVLLNGVKQGLFREDLNSVPLGLMFGVAINSTIRMAGKKARYIADRTGMSKQDFLDFSFRTLAAGVLKAGVEYDG